MADEAFRMLVHHPSYQTHLASPGGASSASSESVWVTRRMYEPIRILDIELNSWNLEDIFDVKTQAQDHLDWNTNHG